MLDLRSIIPFATNFLRSPSRSLLHYSMNLPNFILKLIMKNLSTKNRRPWVIVPFNHILDLTPLRLFFRFCCPTHTIRPISNLITYRRYPLLIFISQPSQPLSSLNYNQLNFHMISKLVIITSLTTNQSSLFFR